MKRAYYLLGVGAFRPIFYGVTPCQYVDTVRLVDRATTLLLEVFRQRNFVADFSIAYLLRFRSYEAVFMASTSLHSNFT